MPTPLRKAIVATGDLAKQQWPTFRNWPRSEQHSLVANIKTEMNDLHSSLCMALKIKPKRVEFLQRAQASVMNLNFNYTISLDQKYVSQGHWEHIDLSLSKIDTYIGASFPGSKKK